MPPEYYGQPEPAPAEDRDQYMKRMMAKQDANISSTTIGNALEYQAKALAELADRVDQLRSRLVPVIRPTPPSDPMAVLKPISHLSATQHDIQDNTQALVAVTDRIVEMIAQLDL